MSASTTDLIKELRDRTGAGLMDCKKALIENNNDLDKSADWLREKGIAKASKKAGRVTKEGRNISYIHGDGKIGVLLELNSETDFVARNEAFEALGKEICLQIAAMAPLYVSEEQVPAEDIERETKVLEAQLKEEGKKPEQIEKIIPGKIKKYFSEVCLLNQAFIKDNTKTVDDLVKEAIAKFGENIIVARFARFQVGGA
ncbi:MULTISPECIES: translation elongation factor Ts [Leptospira]|uniref:Elongation factor Ts n=3 Tax=Leptospira TaxID=171 RepID=A0A4V3JBT0_9LEPT|nr:MULTISPECIES: translation elongation factor Ts [Leptospira]PKA16866.1 translation elongation factor Ts [Leptospira haakeii]PKA19243.1 translation elongation factor Ts [Leptospira haakeii]TGK03409.1 translation elongation factor Ts [Leptospira selangorensis]TGK43507.1 translation elongation factor Ts [Leptospira andrefontaineae]TGM10833.1 translation elongation factor Ts [Leptospira selangorensis]